MKPVGFQYVAPHTTDEVLELLSGHGDDAKVLAGGQSLGPLLNLRLACPSVLVDLRHPADMSTGPVPNGDTVRIGAMCSQRTVECSAVIAKESPMLAMALPFVAHRTIRNRGTVGGSLAHADPSAELPAVLVALDAEVTVRSSDGERTLPVEDVVQGHFTTDLRPDELLYEIRVPRIGPSTGHAWTEFAPRHGDFGIVGVGASVTTGPSGVVSDARIVCSGVADRPWRAREAEAALLGSETGQTSWVAAGRAAAGSCSPTGDLIATADYRRHLVSVLVTRAVAVAAGGQATA